MIKMKSVISKENENINEQLNILLKEYKCIIEKSEDSEEIISLVNDIVQQYKMLRYEPPREITIPEIFNRSYDENFISDFFAYV
jgi:hypothetical protein